MHFGPRMDSPLFNIVSIHCIHCSIFHIPTEKNKLVWGSRRSYTPTLDALMKFELAHLPYHLLRSQYLNRLSSPKLRSVPSEHIDRVLPYQTKPGTALHMERGYRLPSIYVIAGVLSDRLYLSHFFIMASSSLPNYRPPNT